MVRLRELSGANWLRPREINQPFWPVTMLSGALATLTLALLAATYGVRHNWRYLALSGLVVAIVAAHVVAWFQCWRRGRYTSGIRLIATFQILSAVLAPFFMADYWMMGLLLLAVVPLEVGAADRMRHLSLFVALALLGAAAMLAVDLLALPGRVLVTADRPAAGYVTLALVALHLTGLAYIIWHFRLRRGAAYRVRLDFATQQALLFIAISATSLVLVTGVLIERIRASQIEQVGGNFQTFAAINGERAGNTLEQQVDALISFANRDDTVAYSLAQANSSYPASRVDALNMLHELDSAWQTFPENSDFVLRYRDNLSAQALIAFRGANLLHDHILLIDRYGGLVGAQGAKPAMFYYGDERWWKDAWNSGQGDVYIGKLEYDPVTRVSSVLIAVGVRNQTYQTVGVLASTYRLSAIQNEIDAAQSEVSGHVRLLTAGGTVIAGPETATGAPQQDQSDLEAATTVQTGRPPPEPDWRLSSDNHGVPVVVAHAPLNTSDRGNLDALGRLGWQVTVSDTQANALAGVTRSTKIATLVGLLALTAVVLAGFATAQIITRPLEVLTATAAAIGAGDLERHVDPRGPVEMATLAETFNTLTERLRGLVGNLQEQVAQRTAQLEEAKGVAEAANAAKSKFIANVSHELRTPLTSVLGFTRIVQKRLDGVIFPEVEDADPKVRRAIGQVRENLSIMLTEGERLTSLINELLDLSKIEAGKVAWHMEPINLAGVLEQATAATASLLATKDLALIVSVPEGLPEIIGDRDRLVQVVINLLSNAVKFTERGSVTCRIERGDAELILSVSDTGVGIARADFDELFKEFVQVGDGLRGKTKGTGLGLAISKQIIEQHRGRIWLDSEPGKGSTFSFALPIPRAEPLALAAASSPNVQDGERYPDR